jgi:hypothetical protein
MLPLCFRNQSVHHIPILKEKHVIVIHSTVLTVFYLEVFNIYVYAFCIFPNHVLRSASTLPHPPLW